MKNVISILADSVQLFSNTKLQEPVAEAASTLSEKGAEDLAEAIIARLGLLLGATASSICDRYFVLEKELEGQSLEES